MTDQPEDDNIHSLMKKAAERSVGSPRSRATFLSGYDEISHIPAKGSGSGRTLEEMIEAGRQEYLATLVRVPYARHLIIASAIGVGCHAKEFGVLRMRPCRQPATHKMAEVGGDPTIHELTAYVCCEHFRANMGRCTAHG